MNQKPEADMSWAPSRGLALWLRGLRGWCSVSTTSPATKTTPAACHDPTTPRLARTCSAARAGCPGPRARSNGALGAAMQREGASALFRAAPVTTPFKTK